jgi:hypothetical protein
VKIWKSPVPGGEVRSQRLLRRLDLRPIQLPGDMDHLDVRQQVRERRKQGLIYRASPFAAAKDKERRQGWIQIK